MMEASTPRYADRTAAGRHLARAVSHLAGTPNLLVLALPRGGVPVAFEVARALRAPLDVFVVRKLGAPFHEELAMGAVASGGVRVVNHEVVASLRIPDAAFEEKAREELTELERRERAYRDARPPVAVDGKVVVLVDDGLATGSTMRAAIAAVRQQDPERIVLAVPIASQDTCDEMRAEADEVVCAHTPEPFVAVGLWYHDFSQTTDAEVREVLARAGRELPRAGANGAGAMEASRPARRRTGT
jgi:predicted phosphoribosyltransferase